MYFDPPIVPLFWRVAVFSAVRCCIVFVLLCFLIVGIHASGISIPLFSPVDVMRVKSCADILTDPTCVPLTISINKLGPVRNWIVAGPAGVL